MSLGLKRLICIAVTLIGACGCAGQGDVDRTQANRFPKSMFEDEWYLRSTVIEVPPSSVAGFAGLTGKLKKVRWEIQEEYLVAYRSHEEFPGTVSDQTGDPQLNRDGEFTENPVFVCPIEKHFDIKRDYNPATGEQRNVIEENEEDRPWFERDFMRVDWAQCEMELEQFYRDSNDESPRLAYYQQTFEGGPEAMRVIDEHGDRVNFDDLSHVQNAKERSVDYFDFVTNAVLDPATIRWRGRRWPLCYFRVNGRDYGTTTCGSSEVKVRTSFLKAKPRNFEPVFYGDHEMGKFGYFRTERLAYDRRQGFTESGRIYLANVYNIWQQAYQVNSDGTFRIDQEGNRVLIPMEDREPKPIIYHLNRDFPCEMVATAQRVAADWNQAFRRAVAIAKGYLTKTSGVTELDLIDIPEVLVPNMFQLNLNGWRQREEGTNWSCENLEFYEEDVVAELGDLRFNIFGWINDRQVLGPLGYGPSSADPETGEIISGVAYVYGAAVDRHAQDALEIVRLLNNDLDIEDIVTGQDVVDYISENRQSVDPRSFPDELLSARGHALRAKLISTRLQGKIEQIRLHGLEEAIPGESEHRLNQVKGTELELALLDEELVSGLAPVMLPEQPIDATTVLSAEELETLSPLQWLTETGDQTSLDEARHEYAIRNNIWLAEFADDSIAGLAEEVWRKYGEDRDYDAIFQYLREQIAYGVYPHEVGHAVGLRHNFSGSYDSINFHNEWWLMRARPDNTGRGGIFTRDPLVEEQALSFAETLAQTTLTEEQKAGRMREYEYSSIMDYHSRFNSDIHGLGKYDEAAIAFAYAGQVESFEFAPVAAREQLRKRFSDCAPYYEGRSGLSYRPFLEDWHYSSAWNLLGQTEGVVQRVFRPWRDVKQEQDKALAACKDFVAQGGEIDRFFNEGVDLGDGLTERNRFLEVPYIFCGDEFVGATVSCHRWDQGADPFEMVRDVLDRYENYYFFNNYRRDQFGFNAFQVFSRIYGRYFSYLPNIYQHWLFRVAFNGVSDINLENYWTMGMEAGLNALINVMAKPEYGTYCATIEGDSCQEAGDQWIRISRRA